MKRLLKRLEDVYSAVAFAEAGEFDTAREILKEEERPRKLERIRPVQRPRKELRAPGIDR